MEQPLQIVVASKNPAKVRAVANGFTKIFSREVQIERVAAPSGVRDQPMTSVETLTGARNRVAHIRQLRPNADFWVGIEGGIEHFDHRMEAFGWIVIQSPHQTGEAKSANFFLPPEIARRIDAGEELGPVNDDVFGATNSKHKGGAVGLLTNEAVSRTGLYEQALLLALIPFIHPQHYPA
ncbi:MAG: inosine/xanthosine triphosphatase [Bacteroidota bacterium]